MTFRIIAVAVASWVLHFTWEMAQAGLFVEMQGLPLWTATRWCAGAAVWDVAIAAAAYSAAAITARNSRWILAPIRAVPLFVFLATGGLITVIIEKWAVATAHWTYTAAMPVLAGVGVAPLAQWIIVPLLLFLLARRCLRPPVRPSQFARR